MVLFEADLRRKDPLEILASVDDPAVASAMVAALDGDDAAATVRIDGLTQRLVEGVAGRKATIDAAITAHARGWQLHRMPAVDRTLLRLAISEMLDGDVSPAVVINEAVELAKAYSTADSSRYLNGVLESLRQAIQAGELTVDEDHRPT